MQICSKIQERLQTNCRKLPGGGGGLPSAPVHPPSWGGRARPCPKCVNVPGISRILTRVLGCYRTLISSLLLRSRDDIQEVTPSYLGNILYVSILHRVQIMCTGSSRDVKFCRRRPHSWSSTLLEVTSTCMYS